MARLHRLLRDAWGISAPYWRSQDRWVARGLLLLVVALNLGIVYLNVLLNQWNNAFYNALQDKKYDVFVHQLGRFCWLAALYIVVAVHQLYFNQMLQIRWRRWLTERYLQAWLGNGAYFRMQLASGDTDNPDQRIAEDLQLFVSGTLGLSIGVLRAVVTLVSFVAILWGLSGSLSIPLGHSSVVLPGYMVWVALLYATVGTWLTNRIGRPLVRLNFDQQRYEADFRFSLVRFRENAEGVALYHGEADELRGFGARFGAVVRNFWEIMRRQKRLTWFTAGYGQAALIFPFLVAAPRYFRGALHLGGLMQTASAFGQVQDSLSFIVSSYTDIAAWRSVVERLLGFERALDHVREQQAGGGGIRLVEGDGASVELDGVDLDLPGGQRLIAGVPGSGRSVAARSGYRAERASWFSRRGRICPSAACGTWSAIRGRRRASTTRPCGGRSGRWGCPSSPVGSTSTGTGPCTCPRASSSASPSRAPWSTNRSGSSWTRRPPRWTRRRRRTSTACCASVSPARPCSASATVERCGPCTPTTSSSNATETDRLPWWSERPGKRGQLPSGESVFLSKARCGSTYARP